MSRFVFPNASIPAPIQEFATDIENVFDHLFRGGNDEAAGKRSSVYTPRMNLVEHADRFELTLDLPGVKPNDVSIEMNEEKLTIAGERHGTEHPDGSKVWRMERAFGKFRRVVQLPSTIDAEAIDAVYEDGVLLVRVPKIAKPTPRQIQVKTKNEVSNSTSSESST